MDIVRSDPAGLAERLMSRLELEGLVINGNRVSVLTGYLQQLVEGVAKDAMRPPVPQASTLSHLERTAVLMLAQGYTIAEAARRLDISDAALGQAMRKAAAKLGNPSLRGPDLVAAYRRALEQELATVEKAVRGAN